MSEERWYERLAKAVETYDPDMDRDCPDNPVMIQVRAEDIVQAVDCARNVAHVINREERRARRSEAMLDLVADCLERGFLFLRRKERDE